jgi:hypothetical protein
MRAPQYGKVTNPAAKLGVRVRPFGKIFALVEGLGVISLHQTETDAQTALEGELERRNASHVVKHKDPVEAPKGEHGGGQE